MKIVSRTAVESAGLPVQPLVEFDVEILASTILDKIDKLGTTGIEQAELWRELMREDGYKDDEINIAMMLIKYRNQVVFLG